MSIFRSVLVCCLISFLAGAGLFFLGSTAGYEQFKGGYAVLSFDSSVNINDREIIRRLDNGRLLFGGAPISESSQWVFLDVFGSITAIPLDEYEERVLPFDPRNDGYSSKLKEFFVRDGKRFVFVPLIPGNWKESFLNKQFNNLLHDIPFQVDYYGIGKPLSLYFISYGAASFVLIALYLLKRSLRLRIVNILTLIPLFSSFSFFGAEGIAQASLLFGAFFLLREPLYEISTRPLHIVRKIFFKEIYEPYKSYWISLIFFIIAAGALIFFTGLKLLFVIVIFFTSLAVFYVSSKIISMDAEKRKRFSPIVIKKKQRPEFAFFVYMIPFAAASLFALVFTPYMDAPSKGGLKDSKYTAMISEEDYLCHIEFQASFSSTKLGSGGEFYYSYKSEEDGLPVVSEENERNNINFNDYPAFPLKHLIDFLNNDYNE